MLASIANAQVGEEKSEKKFEVYGFVQSDYIQDFKRVDPNWDATLRPSRIPTESGKFGTDGQAVLSVRQTRFGVTADLPVEDHKMYTKFEFDFFGVGEDEGKTTIRLRHAYGEYRHWLGGQTHSLFMDIDMFPNTIDYWGPAGMVFLRNPQIRYIFSKGANEFAMAIEQPSNDIDPGQFRTLGEDLDIQVQPDENIPDFTAMGRVNRDWGHIQLSGILRRVGYETIGTPNNSPKRRLTGWGLNLTSNFKTSQADVLRLAVVHGNGIASYMNDGGTDMAPEGRLSVNNASVKLVPLTGITAYFDHSWNEKYTSSIGYSRTQVDNTSLQEDDAFNIGEYASVNLLHKPVKNMMVGAEFLWGAQTTKDNSYGEDLRTQISFKYNFSSLDFI